jgi:hypothetical protein
MLAMPLRQTSQKVDEPVDYASHIDVGGLVRLVNVCLSTTTAVQVEGLVSGGPILMFPRMLEE